MKKGPFVFLMAMLVVAFYLAGFRMGQNTEKTNKKIDFILSITPTPPPPTPTPVKYTEYKSKKWGLRFTYPQGLEIKESTNAPEIKFEAR